MANDAAAGAGSAPSKANFIAMLRDLRLSLLNYGPFRFAEPFFWLLFASVLRVIVGVYPALFLLYFAVQFAIVFAFISATARVLERMGGRTTLVNFNFDDTLIVAKAMLWQLVKIILSISFYLVIFLQFWVKFEPQDYMSILLITDGFVFDTYSIHTKVLCSISSLLIFMMTVNAGTGKPVDLAGAIDQIRIHARWMVTALALVAVFLIAISWIQGVVRPMVLELIEARGGAKDFIARLFFYVFVVGFAVARLTAIVGIYTYCLRRSYMRVN
jgi:hypothetical protein